MTTEEKQEKFLTLLAPVRDGLMRFARAMTRNTDDARDLVSETILVAFQNFDKLRKPESFKSYTFTIASRIFKRRRWRSRIFAEYDEQFAENIRSTDSLPDSKADIHRLYSAIDTLPEKQKEAIILFELSGFSLEEVKELQGGTLSGVKSRLKRGREQLAEILAPTPKKRNEIYELVREDNIKKYMNRDANNLECAVASNVKAYNE